jgi:hypothetical protein
MVLLEGFLEGLQLTREKFRDDEVDFLELNVL